MIKIYDQRKLWSDKYEKEKVKAVNNYAKRNFLEIKKHGRLKTLLDLGCGAGQDAVFFAKKGLTVTAVDFSKVGIKLIPKKIKNLKTAYLDIKNLNLKNNSFDIIYAHLSLHYFDDHTTTKIFNKLFHVLKKNGLIFIKCKSIEDDLYGLGKKIETNVFYRKNHIRHFFTKKYMEEKLKDFSIIKIKKNSSTYRYYKSAYIEAIATKK